jgi:hypothetical protein
MVPVEDGLMAALPPKKKLVKSTALVKTQSTLVRLNNLLPTTTTVLSPTTIYQPGTSSVGNELLGPTESLPNISGWYGSWTAPNLNNGSPYQVQVECFGPGGGGGGGISNAGGGGGGGGEYACEPTYTVSPGVTYTYQIGLPGTPGCNNSSTTLAQEGTAGSQTIFDLAGLSVPGGVVANPGQPGDAGSTGIGGTGGTGSANTVAFPGGNGGTNVSSLGSDNPLTLAVTSGYFVGNTLKTSIITAWYIYNDGPDNTFEFNDSTGRTPSTVTTSSTGIKILQSNAPSQVPAYTNTTTDPPNRPNPTRGGCSALWNGAVNTQYGGYAQSPTFSFGGTKTTISCWLQCDPTGTWAQNMAAGVGTIAANSTNYATFGNFGGYGLFMYNTGSAANPVWYVYFNVGNGANVAQFVRWPLPAVTGTWYYVVVTFNSGAMTMYVNGVSVATASAGFSSIPSGAFDTRVGTNPDGTYDFYFGYISNLWFAQDVIEQTAITQAFGGSTSPTGGAGGGASASPGGGGNNGLSAIGTAGGSGGTAISLPAQYASIRTAGHNGVAGANATTGNSGSPGTGAGGGGSGDMAASPASFTINIPFATAATYCGTDSSSPGALYNASQQNTNSVIITGGTSTDTASGSKNTLMLLPKGTASSLGSGKWTIQQITLTLTNALQSSTIDTLLEFAYTADTSLPQTYTGADAVEYVGAIPIDAGDTTITYDLTQSNLGALIQAGTATALCFGPTDNPTFDAFNAATGPQFYCQVYGPGATDSFGNSLSPYLTIVYQETLTTQKGSKGGTGAIAITSLTNATTPIVMVQAFAGTDTAGNQYAQGVTGPITAYNPTTVTPGSIQTETWHSIVPGGSWNASGKGVNGFYYRMLSTGDVQIAWDVSITSSNPGTMVTLPAAYWPSTAVQFESGWSGTGPTSYNDQFNPTLLISSSGAISGMGLFVSGLNLFGTITVPIGPL